MDKKPQLEACLLKSQFHIWKREWNVQHFPFKWDKKKKERKKETFVWQLWKQLSLSRAEGEIKMQMMSFT